MKAGKSVKKVLTHYLPESKPIDKDAEVQAQFNKTMMKTLLPSSNEKTGTLITHAEMIKIAATTQVKVLYTSLPQTSDTGIFENDYVGYENFMDKNFYESLSLILHSPKTGNKKGGQSLEGVKNADLTQTHWFSVTLMHLNKGTKVCSYTNSTTDYLLTTFANKSKVKNDSA
jgi:hypothetical protein